MEVPIIRLEVQGMKQTIMTALSEHSAQMDADIKAAVEEYCTDENLAVVVKSAAFKHLDNAIKEEVKKFFWIGKGRKAVAEAVRESILKKTTYTVLDEIDSEGE